MKKRLKKCFFILLCVIIQINYVQAVFADFTLPPIIEPGHVCSDFTSKMIYGSHTFSGHAAYKKCTVCNKSSYMGYYDKMQDCTSCYSDPPDVTIKNLSSNITLGKIDTNFKLQIDVNDSRNRRLLCEYFINERSDSGSIYYSTMEATAEPYSFDSIILPGQEIPGEIVSGTSSTQTVTFSKSINATSLPQGINRLTVKIRILDGWTNAEELDRNLGYAAIARVTFNVDTKAAIIEKCSAATTYNSADISVSAYNNITSPIEYRYTVGSNATGWLSAQKTYTVNNLSPNTVYSYMAQARDKNGNISSANNTFITKPQSPTVGLAANSNNSIKINLSDNNPSDTLYKIKIGDEYLYGDGSLSTTEAWRPIPSKTVTITNLDGNTEYKVIAYVKDRYDSNEVASMESSIKTTPLAPTGLTCANKTNSSINLSWNASSGAYAYDLMRETLSSGIVTETKQFDNIVSTSFNDTGLLTEQTYRYKIRAKLNLTTYGEWSETELEVVTSPEKPLKTEKLTAAIQSSNINLSWTGQSRAVGYEILINEQQKKYSQTNSISIPFAAPNMQYLLYVRAFNVCDLNNPNDTSKWTNEGEWSDPVLIYTPSNIPKDITFSNITFDSVQFTWNKNNNPESVVYKCMLYKGDTMVRESNEINTDSFRFSGLEAQTQYTVKICAINSNKIQSDGMAENVFSTKIEPPDAPSQLRISSKDRQITLSWEQSTRAENYTIKRNGTIIADNITDNKFVDTGLTPNTAYSYEVVASNESGKSVSQISGKTKGEAPGIPEEIKFERFNTYIQISWDEIIGAIGYNIKCDGKIYNTELNTDFEHSGLIPGSVHTYSVRSRNIYDNGEWSAPVTVKAIPKAPIMPDGIKLTAGQTKIDISWNQVENADSYVVSIDGNEIKEIKIPEYTHSFDDSVAPESKHVIKIMSVNEGGNSGYTAPQSIKLLPRIDDVPEVSGKVESGAIYITWNNIENTSGYEIEIDSTYITTASAITASYVDFDSSLTEPHTYRVRAIFGEKTGNWSYPVTVKAIPAVPSQITGISGQNIITVQWSNCDTANIYELSADGVIIYAGPNTEFIHSSLSDGSIHSYMVRAGNNSGYGEWSESVALATEKGISNIPQNIKPSKISQGSIVVSWDLVKDAKGYMVKINDGQLQNISVPMIGIAVTPQAIYAVSVAAVLDYEQNLLGEWSQEISFCAPPAVPEIPVIKQVNTTEFAIELNWDNVAYAQGYEVEVDNNKITKVYSNIYCDSDVPSKTTRSYRIRSYNESGTSSWSESISASTDEALPGAPINLLCKSALTTTGSAISIDWNDVKDAVSYEVKDYNGNCYAALNSSIVIDGLKNGTLYQFQVRASTEKGQGPWSSIVYCVTNISATKNFIISNEESGGMRLSWDKLNEASQYEIEMDGIIIAKTEETSINISQTYSYLTHSFRIRALNVVKTGEWTEQLTYNQNIALKVEVDAGEEFSVMMPVSNVKYINQYKMTITINTDEIELIDVCEFTPEADITATYFENGNMQIIVENIDNLCYITIFVKNENGKEMTGIINSIRLIGKIRCTSEIKYSVDILQ